ncbi:MAG: dehypoxanthine futalosine cyclase [Armatimonadetes bacterium]|nr:dehypoxanthine futalosine cyclase [Armatimonadota bacterium]
MIRINLKEALNLYNKDLFYLGRIAQDIRKKLHPGKIVTFVIDRNINYTNICISKCKFCAFYKTKDGFLLSIEEILKKVKELVKLGGTQVMLQGGLHPKITLEYFISVFKKIKSKYPFIHLHSLSPPEIDHLAKISNLSIKEVIKKLKASGLDSLPGGGAEILVDRIKERVSPHKINSTLWLKIMETAHSLGLHSTATMVYNLGESLKERLIHLEKIRSLQDKTHGFKAFIPWSFSSKNTKIKAFEGSGLDYLKTLAISRIFLDNIPHIHSGWVTEGKKLAQVALHFGANDLGGILIEEQVIKATGLNYQINLKEIIQLIKDAGFNGAQRNSFYEIIKYYN